jgi:hypothetical protein
VVRKRLVSSFTIAPHPNPSPACGRGTKGWILRYAQNDKVNDTEGSREGTLAYGICNIFSDECHTYAQIATSKTQ